MDDFLNDAADVPVLFCIVNGTELDGSNTRAGVGREDATLALPLRLSFTNRSEIQKGLCIIHRSVCGIASWP